MLIVTRNIGESLIIAGEIKVILLGRKGNQIKVGIKAPKEITVHREEVCERIHLEESEKKEKADENDSDNQQK